MNAAYVPLLVSGFVLPMTGCANLDSRNDYERAQRSLAYAAGYSDMYRPQDDALVAGRTAELLVDGITLDEAVRVALLNNPSFQAATAEIGIARSELAQSGLLSNPTLGIGSLLPSDGGGLVNLQLDLAQNVSELWQIRPRRRAASANLDLAVLAVAGRAVGLVGDVKSAYFDAVGAGEILSVAAENVDNVRQVHRAATARREAGAGTEVDVNLAEELVVDAELADLRARLEDGDARRRLATLLGLTVSAGELHLADPLPAVRPPSLDAAAIIEHAYRHRLDLKAAARNVVAASQRYALELRRAWPDMELGVAFERDERRGSHEPNVYALAARSAITANRIAAADFRPPNDPDDDQTYILGPTLNIELPIFDRNRAQISRAQFEYLQSVKQFQAIERAVVHEVQGAAERAAAAWSSLEIYQSRSVPLAERNLALARESYELGRTTFLNVLEAQRFYLQARTRYVENQTAAAKSLAKLEQAIGTPIERLAPADSNSEASPSNSEVQLPDER